MSNKQLGKEFVNKPIILPGSPFWNVMKTFGRDEAFAWVFNTIGTIVFEILIRMNFVLVGASQGTHVLALSLIGPIVEKFGFFVGHVKEACEIYKTTPVNERKSRLFYFKRAVKGGTKSLIYDLLVHDPIYVILMFVGQKLLPTTPAWLLAMSSFVFAVFLVAGLDVFWEELKYWLFKQKLKKFGFGIESYYESRFLISSKRNPQKLVKKISKEFNLTNSKTFKYSDQYYADSLSSYSGRSSKIRIRNRTKLSGTFFRTIQIVYSRASQLESNLPEQFNFFPQYKEKLYYKLKNKSSLQLHNLENKFLQKFMKSVTDERTVEIDFERTLNYGDELLVCVDKVKNLKKPYFFLELKTYKDKLLLKEAMRYVMLHFPVLQITHGKLEMNQIKPVKKIKKKK
ncbi:hypothetical protein HN587_00255 [Candidatus Woesearchaeota archaeon]|nr:hypothetical protein [Candidatus Woesearchaeota archaeon]